MAGMLRKGMSWLGLGPDEEYDDYYEELTPEVDLRRSTADAASPVRPLSRDEPAFEEAESSSASVRVLPTGAARASRVYPSESPAPRTTIVRPLPASAGPSAVKPHIVVPESFNDAQQVGDWFRKRQPVILNLQGLDRDLARRLLDFASGVAYGLAGRVEKVAAQVYLLTPADVEIPADERDRLRDRGFQD